MITDDKAADAWALITVSNITISEIYSSLPLASVMNPHNTKGTPYT